MTGAVAGALDVPPQAASIPHKAKKIETGKIAKSAFLLRLEFDELSCFQEVTQISNNRMLRLDCARARVRIEARRLEALPFGPRFSSVMSLVVVLINLKCLTV